MNRNHNIVGKQVAMLILIVVSALGVYACTGSKLLHDQNSTEPRTVDELEVERYMGRWYEIGRLPMFFQRKCLSHTTANYKIISAEKIHVVNQCQAKHGKLIKAEGVGLITSHPAKLKVSFAPRWINWLPITQADYWVLKLDPDYRYALVGTPDRKYLWLLSRTPVMPENVYKNYLAQAKKQGYKLNKWQKTPHNPN